MNTLDDFYRQVLQTPRYESPKIDIEVSKDVFLNKSHYPALEIAYLAVAKNLRYKGLGRIIIESIVQKAQEQELAGCQFLTVEALNTNEYSAVGFYNKCNFSACELPDPNKGTLRMFRTLYPVVK